MCWRGCPFLLNFQNYWKKTVSNILLYLVHICYFWWYFLWYFILFFLPFFFHFFFWSFYEIRFSLFSRNQLWQCCYLIVCLFSILLFPSSKFNQCHPVFLFSDFLRWLSISFFKAFLFSILNIKAIHFPLFTTSFDLIFIT